LIERIQLVRNIGQFDSVSAGAQIPFTKLTLLYAENSRGKTTLAAILRSLSRNGRDLTGTSRGLMVIDLFGLEADEVRKRFPEVYQHVLETVKECKDEQGRPNGRDVNNRESYRLNWWIFGEPRRELRPALENLPRYIATVETAKHRVFQFLDASILPDNRLVCFAFADAYQLGVLSSRIHVLWTLANGGTLEDRPIYTKVRCFDPFPFPDPSEILKARIRETSEDLDALRKQFQAEHPGLTLTQMYNVLEKLRGGAPLDAEDEAIKTKCLVLILRESHDKLDQLVAEAYGWPTNLSDDEILAKLVSLNAERAAEEKRGVVRWLRPEYQRARAGVVPEPAQEQLEASLIVEAGKGQKPAFPTSDLERTGIVFAALMQANQPLDAGALARSFRQGVKVEPAISRILASLARLGHVHTSDGKTFALRRAA
jgi:hypothetical protein